MPHTHAPSAPCAPTPQPTAALLRLVAHAAGVCVIALPAYAADPAPATATAPKSVPVTQGKVELPLGNKLADQVRVAIEHNKSVDNARVSIDTTGKVLATNPATSKNTAIKAPAAKTVAPVMTAEEAAYLRQKAKANGTLPPKTTAKVAAPAAAAPPPAPKPHVDEHWSYTGHTGPENWGKLKPDYERCAQGLRQSPINIQSSETLLGPAEPLRFQYRTRPTWYTKTMPGNWPWWPF